MTGSDDMRPDNEDLEKLFGTKPEPAGASPGPHGKGNGKAGEPNPFANVSRDTEDDRWRQDLPTAAEIAGTPLAIYSAMHLRALAKLWEVDPEGYLSLTRNCIEAARHPDVTRTRLDEAVKAGARKVKQAAKAEVIAISGADDSLPVADQLVQLVMSLTTTRHAILGHTQTGVAYIRCPIGKDILATYRVEGAQFKSWLRRRYYGQTQKSLRADVLNQATSTLAALADDKGEKIDRLFVRVAKHGGRLYLDLGTDAWSAIEIGPGLGEGGCGWRPKAKPPVWFIRSPAAKPLPMPVPGGSINELRPFLSIARDRPDDNDCLDSGFILAVGHCIGALRPDGPYAITLGQGPDGAAKTSWLRLMRSLIDPSHADRRGPPATTLELLRHAEDSWMPSFDNVTSLPIALCNALCRLSTGGGESVRKLYTDNDALIYESTRPVLMTSIMDPVSRPDILSRTMIVTLAKPEDGKTRTEEELFPAFDAVHPRILGALLSAAAHGLAQPAVSYPLPRLADFAMWVSQCEGALGWPPGTFIGALQDNAAFNVQDAADSDPLVGAVYRILGHEPVEPAGRHHWEGRVSELQGKIRAEMGDYEYRVARLPQTANHFSGRLRQATPLLSRVGITMTRPRSNKSNNISLWLRPEETEPQDDEPESPPTPQQTPPSPMAKPAGSPRPPPDLHLANPQKSAISGDRGDRGHEFFSLEKKKKNRGDNTSARTQAQSGAAGRAGQDPEELW